jgi:hypothetical protein
MLSHRIAKKEYQSLNINIISEFFSKEECEECINYMKTNQEEFLGCRKRIRIEEPYLAKWYYERLPPQPDITDEYGNVWKPIGVNPMFRLIRYDKGDYLDEHEDGVYQPSHDTRSFSTAMVYLNDVPVEHGGSTRFSRYGLDIQPVEGLLVLFQVDGIFHTGEKLLNGVKYILRTDVMYECKNLKQEDIHKEMFKTDLDSDVIEEFDKYFKLKSQLIKM